MSLDRRLIGPHIYFFRIRKFTNCRILDIDRHIDQYRSFSSGISDIERLLEDSRNLVGAAYQIAVFNKGFRRSGNIRLLKHIRTEQFAVYLSRNTHKRYTVRKRRRNSCNHIGCPRTGSHCTDSHLSRHPRQTARRMCRVLLRAHQDRIYFRIQYTVIERAYRHTRITEYIFHALFFQASYHCICT